MPGCVPGSNSNVEWMRMNTEVTIALYGAFRQAMDRAEIRLSIGEGDSVADLRRCLAGQLPDDRARALLGASAFATDDEVLRDRDPVPVGRVLAVLPPVCGG
jgi:molybdopterin converting factor small subunit